MINDEAHYDTFYDELHRVALLAVENKTAIAHIYYSKSRDVLDNYLFTISKNLVKNFARQRLTVSSLLIPILNSCAIFMHIRLSALS